MRNYVIINGVNSLTIQGLAINNLPPITKPMIRTQREEIDGRDGDIVTELGYSAYDKQIEIGLWGTYDINDIIKYFTGEGTIVFSNEEDKYYNFKILDQIDYQKLLKFKTATITFHCQPFKYPLEEEPVEAEITTLTGTGETITLNNTEEAPMSLVYKGNTYQDSTTGANLFPLNTSSFPLTSGVFTATLNSDGTIQITGTKTATGWANVNLPRLNNPVFQAGQTYTTGITLQMYKQADDAWIGNTSGTFTPSENWVAKGAYWATNQVKTFNEKIYPMIIKGSTTIGDNNFEPYTGGIPAPNPDYPQPIQVVSGDNSIVVCGKNFANVINVNGNLSKSEDIITLASGSTGSNFIDFDEKTLEANVEYILELFLVGTTTNNVASELVFRDSNNNVIFDSSAILNGNVSKTFTPTSAITIYRLNIYNSSNPSSSTPPTTGEVKFKIQIRKSSATSGYESYTGESYPVSLGVENIATTYKTSGSGYFNYNYDNSKVSKNMTLSFMPNITTTGATIYARPKDNGTLYTLGTISTITSGVKASLSFTLTDAQITEIKANTGGFFQIYRTNVDFTESSLSDIQLTEGSTPQYVSETPIELCKIGTYQDKIDKSSGKNLFDKDNANIYNGYFTVSSPTITSSSSHRTIYIPIEPNTTYTIQKSNAGGNDSRFAIGTTTTIPTTSVSVNQVQLDFTATHMTITTNAGSKYLVVWCYFTNNTAITFENVLSTIQVEKGSQATTYEPYGTSWYVKKEIGKVVLNGSETGWAYNTTNTNFNIRAYNLGMKSTSMSKGYIPKVCSHFKYFASDGNHPNLANGIYENINDNTISFLLFHCDSLNITTLQDWYNWLSTNKPIIYYKLETPTYTLIEDSTLIEELESMKKSREGQTNITQENNDLPFELDVSVTFLTPMEINNIGNIYAKPILTIEGTGNIGVVLNDIQILDIDLTNNGKIAIDVTKLEAYNPDDDTLLNRLVTGDYMKLLINEGENTITFTGNVSGATLTNYIRWI